MACSLEENPIVGEETCPDELNHARMNMYLRECGVWSVECVDSWFGRDAHGLGEHHVQKIFDVGQVRGRVDDGFPNGALVGEGG